MNEEEDPTPQIRKSSRLSKSACIVTDEKTPAKKRGVLSQKTLKTGPPTSSKASTRLKYHLSRVRKQKAGPRKWSRRPEKGVAKSQTS